MIYPLYFTLSVFIFTKSIYGGGYMGVYGIGIDVVYVLKPSNFDVVPTVEEHK